jgi:F1F0 ATPase subunit 2
MDAQAMTSFHLGEQALLALRACAWLGGGALIGGFYFLTLRWNVRMLVLGRAPLLAMALQLGRFALLAGVLAMIASRFGALPLLVATAGIFAARTAAVRLGGQT